MKRNLKKFTGMLLMLVWALALTACSSKTALPNEEVYQEKADSYIKMLSSMDEDSLNQQVEDLENNLDDFEQEIALYPYIMGNGSKFDFTADAYVSLLKSYVSNLDDLGTYVGLKAYEGGEEKEDEVTFSAVYEFEKHDLRLSLVFDRNNVITTVTLDPVYSTGEILEKAALNTLLGMGVVFAVLILICLIISCFGFIPAIEAKFKKKTPEKKAAQPAKAPVVAPVQEAASNETDDLELVAVITAAVAATLGTSEDGFVVRSIKRKSNNKWKRA